MNIRLGRVSSTLAVLALVAGGVRAADVELAKKAHAILVNRCASCHGDTKPRVAGRNVFDRETLVKQVEGDGRWLADSGTAEERLENSNIWQAIDVDFMPYNAEFTSVPLPDDEREMIRKWIEDGATFPGNLPRPFLAEKDVLKAISTDLFDNDRRIESRRYFSIHHLHNNYERISKKELRLYRAALSKSINSLTNEPRIVKPRPIDGTHDTVFAIDLIDFGWDDELPNGQTKWQRVVSAYPFGFEPAAANSEAFNQFQRIERAMGANFDRVAYIRADWFIATATRPPLYHDILEIPKQLSDLEESLGVDRQKDFLDDTLARSGVQESGVSAQNRLVDWHPMNRQGSYWISYDFKFNSGKSNLARFPLGPKFDDNPFPTFAFEHDGGEVIYHLPNGMQAYMLVDDKGNRIRSGPVSIVWDTRQVSGTPEIVNGLSCMGCHQYGTRDMTDVIGPNAAAFNQGAIEKILDLYGRNRFREKLERDQEIFRKNYSEAAASFLQVDEDADKDIGSFPEPVAFVALQYGRDMRLADVAYELGMEPATLQVLLQANVLSKLGIRPLAEGEAIKRSMWSAIDVEFSPFHEAMRELRLGVPISVENITEEIDEELEDD